MCTLLSPSVPLDRSSKEPIYVHERVPAGRSLPDKDKPWQCEALFYLKLASYFAHRLTAEGSAGLEARQGMKAYLNIARFALNHVGALESKLGVHLLVLEAQLADSSKHFKKKARLNKQALDLSRKVYDNNHPWTGLALFNRAEDFLTEPKSGNSDVAVGMLEEVVEIMSRPESAIGDQFTPEFLAYLRKAAIEQIANVKAPLV